MSLNLKHYSALAAAFIAAKSETDAQVVYTDLPDDTLYRKENYELDLNNDGKIDFEISFNTITNGTGCSFSTRIISAIVTPIGQNQIVATNNFALALQCENEIDEASPWTTHEIGLGYYVRSIRCSGCGGENCYERTGSNGNWIEAKDHYLGLKVINGKDTTYGWVRMEVNPRDEIIIKDYAYEASSGAQILAGDFPCADYKLASLPPGPLFGCPNPGFHFSVQNTCSTFQWFRNDIPISGADSNVYVADTTGFYFVAGHNAFGCMDTSNVTQVITSAAPSKPSITRITDTLVSSLADKYQWWNENAPISGATSQKFVPTLNSENYIVSVANDSSNCYTPSDSIVFGNCNLVDKSIYDRDGKMTADSLMICLNDYLQLSVSCNYNFIWYKDGSAIEQGVNYCTFFGPGLYYCQITGFDTTCLSNSVNIDYDQNPIIYRHLDTLISSPAETYVWSFNYNIIVGADSQKYLASSNGIYSVVVHYNSQCVAESGPFEVGDITSTQSIPTGIPLIVQINQRLLQVKFFNSDFLQGKIKIINALGQTEREVSIDNNIIQIPFSENETGWFVLDIEKDEHRFFSPILIF